MTQLLNMSRAALLAVLLFPAAASAQFYGEAPRYDSPALYLKPGPQSAVSMTPPQLRASLGISTAASAEQAMGAVFNWLSADFRASAAGGVLIGRTTADGLIKSRELSGCHDWALLFSAVMRRLGYPALMADAAGIKWARGYRSGGAMSGHVFAEVYADGGWLLVDPASGRYVKDYDPRNPVIPMEVGPESDGLYVMFKGADPKSYGITGNKVLTGKMRELAARLPGVKLNYPSYKVLQLPRNRQVSRRTGEKVD